MPAALDISVEIGDVTSFDADVVVVKYARRLYGVAELVAQRLMSAGIALQALEPAEGSYRYVSSRGAIQAPHVLIIGVPPLQEFLYPQIQDFAATSLGILARESPATRHVAMTIHGGGYGLDESESLRSTLRGCYAALAHGAVPHALARISIVDNDPKRVRRLREVLRFETPAVWARPVAPPSQTQGEGIATSAKGIGTHGGSGAGVKHHAFVAMPFSAQMEDVFYFGIQAPVHGAGLLCERIDHSVFTGSIMEAMLHKIESASVVIAELTGLNENVFLEVGYAWGKGKPTILLARQDLDLPFDVQGHKCLKYGSIKDLEEKLASELEGLRAQGVINQEAPK